MDSKIILSEKEIPTEWYNIIPDLPFSLPPATGPRTGYLVGPYDLEDLFPRAPQASSGRTDRPSQDA